MDPSDDEEPLIDEFMRDRPDVPDPPGTPFINLEDLQHSVIGKILRGQFHDPLLNLSAYQSQGVLSETPQAQFQIPQHPFVPCQFPPPYHRVSEMNGRQQYRCLKVISAENPYIFPRHDWAQPTNGDRRLYKKLRPLYEAEQEKFIKYAKSLWTSTHYTRALSPKPHVEKVYEAEFRMKEKEINSYPKMYVIAVQISLETTDQICEIILEKRIKSVSIKTLPRIEFEQITPQFFINEECDVPLPCTKHPYKFILPNQKSVTTLPLTLVQKELAQFGIDNNSRYVASENSLKCLVEFDRSWTISVAVFAVIGPDGKSANVVVLGSEFPINKEPVLVRTYRAFKHLLHHALIPPQEKPKLNESDQTNVVNVVPLISEDDDKTGLRIDEASLIQLSSDDKNAKEDTKSNSSNKPEPEPMEEDNGHIERGAHPSNVPLTSDDEDICLRKDENEASVSDDSIACVSDFIDVSSDEGRLWIEEGSPKQSSSDEHTDDQTSQRKKMKHDDEIPKEDEAGNTPKERVGQSEPMEEDNEHLDTCVCKDTIFQVPPPRSFKRWQVKNKITKENYNVIVHSAHKLRDGSGEIILEPIPEYQLDLGGCAEPHGRIRSLALSLLLHEKASLVKVRIDGQTCEVATIEKMDAKQFESVHGSVIDEVANTLHNTFTQFQKLLPGHYILRHEPSNADSAMLYAANSSDQANFEMSIDFTFLEQAEEAFAVLNTPPTLTPVLLPFHMFRKNLPCAFSPHKYQYPKPTQTFQAPAVPARAPKVTAQASCSGLQAKPGMPPQQHDVASASPQTSEVTAQASGSSVAAKPSKSTQRQMPPLRPLQVGAHRRPVPVSQQQLQQAAPQYVLEQTAQSIEQHPDPIGQPQNEGQPQGQVQGQVPYQGPTQG